MNFFNSIGEKKLLTAGGIVLLIAAFFSVGFHHFDEHFQIYEFASLKLGLAQPSDMAWEYPAKMRSALQPTLVVLGYRFFEVFNVANPFFIAALFRFMSAFLAFGTIWLLIQSIRNEIKLEHVGEWFIPLSLFLWFGVYNAIRFSSENWSAIFFVIGFCFAFRNTSWPKYFGAGLLFGVSFLLRFQSGFLVAGFFTWLLFIRKEKSIPLFLLTLGVLISIGAGAIIDHGFYGEWTLTCWNYFNQNILQGKAAGFGVHPWWWYITEVFLQALPPFSLLYILSVFLFFVWKPKHVFTFTLLPFLLVHFIVGHKEVRFLFPMIYFLPFIATSVIQETYNKWNLDWSKQNWWKFFVGTFWVSNFVMLLVVMFRPADSNISLYQTVYNTYNKPTILFYTSENPYHRVLDIHWYKRDNLSFQKIDSPLQINTHGDTTLLFVTQQQQTAQQLNRPHTLIYTGLPEWLRQFNFNGWIDRSKTWSVYELN